MRPIVTVLCVLLLITFLPILGCQPCPEKKACAGEIYQVMPSGAMLEMPFYAAVAAPRVKVAVAVPACAPVVVETPCCAVAVHRHPVLHVVKGAAHAGVAVVRVGTAPIRWVLPPYHRR